MDLLPSPMTFGWRWNSRQTNPVYEDIRRFGSGFERSKTPMLSSPRKPPEKRLLPSAVFAVHPPGEIEQQLLECAFKEKRDHAARADQFIL